MGYVENQNRNRAQARANFQERYNPLDGVVEAIAKIDRESRAAAASEAERIAAKEKDAKTNERNAASDARAATAAGEVSAQRKFEMNQAQGKANREKDERSANQFLDEMVPFDALEEQRFAQGLENFDDMPEGDVDIREREQRFAQGLETTEDMPEGDVDIAEREQRAIPRMPGARMREGGVSMRGRGTGTVEEFAAVVRRVEAERQQANEDRAAKAQQLTEDRKAKAEAAAATLRLKNAQATKAERGPTPSKGKTPEEIARDADKARELALRIQKLENDLDPTKTPAANERQAKFAAAIKDVAGLRASIKDVINSGPDPGPVTGRARSAFASMFGDQAQTKFEAYASAINTQLFGFLRTDAPSVIENAPMDKLRILSSDKPGRLKAKLDVIDSLIKDRLAEPDQNKKLIDIVPNLAEKVDDALGAKEEKPTREQAIARLGRLEERAKAIQYLLKEKP